MEINQNNRLKIVDFLRGFAIFTIVMMHLLMKCHFPGIGGKIIMLGGAGVHVFFLCSGFGLFVSHFKRPLSYTSFLKKRFLKIYGPYVMCVLLVGAWFLYCDSNFPTKEVLSHIFLWKMFSAKFDTSLCYAFWFVSTIIQFYIAWPLIIKIMSFRFGFCFCIAISVAWSSIVCLLGFQDIRPWSSFFLQYLWEFCLGIFLAKKFLSIKSSGCFLRFFDEKTWKYRWLFAICFLFLGIDALMAYAGGVLKMFNDAPSLLGYLFGALIIYKMSFRVVNSFFFWVNSFGYELYLLHSLAYMIAIYILDGCMPFVLVLCCGLILAFALSFVYSKLLVLLKLR